jgi:hypothetical protein
VHALLLQQQQQLPPSQLETRTNLRQIFTAKEQCFSAVPPFSRKEEEEGKIRSMAMGFG